MGGIRGLGRQEWRAVATTNKIWDFMGLYGNMGLYGIWDKWNLGAGILGAETG